MILLTPLKYLKIQHRSKLAYDVVLPILLGGALTWLVVFWADSTPIFGKDGYLSSLQNLLTILGGFFVAALTLITTADLAVLREPISDVKPPKLPNEDSPLSRKRFLAYLFGYLATSSFLLVGITIILNLAAPTASEKLPRIAHDILKMISISVFNFWLAHVFIATMLGMYYFTERLQISDRKPRVGRPDAPPTPLE